MNYHCDHCKFEMHFFEVSWMIRSLSFQRGNSLLFFYLQRIPNWFTSFNEDLYSPQEDALECIEKIILFFKQLVPKGPKKELSSVGKNQDSWPYPNISRGVNHLWCCFSSHWSHVCISKNSLLLRKCFISWRKKQTNFWMDEGFTLSNYWLARENCIW